MAKNVEERIFLIVQFVSNFFIKPADFPTAFELKRCLQEKTGSRTIFRPTFTVIEFEISKILESNSDDFYEVGVSDKSNISNSGLVKRKK